MKTLQAFDFQVDKASSTVHIKREFAAPLPLVWDAYTKSEILDQWWAPKPWKARTKSQDFREGGTWVYAMVGPNGEEHWALVNYTSIIPQKMFTGLDAFSDANGVIDPSLPQARWEVKFHAKGDSTLVEIQTAYADLSQLEKIIEMGFREGFALAMEGLDELLPSLRH